MSEPGPISLNSPARNLIVQREKTKKLCFSVGDKVHIILRGRPKNGVIENYNGRERYPYKVMFYDGSFQWYSVSKLYSGNVTGTDRTTKTLLYSLNIIHCDPPVNLVFD